MEFNLDEPAQPITVNQVQPAVDGLLSALSVLMYVMALILLSCGPAIVIAVWKVLL